MMVCIFPVLFVVILLPVIVRLELGTTDGRRRRNSTNFGSCAVFRPWRRRSDDHRAAGASGCYQPPRLCAPWNNPERLCASGARDACEWRCLPGRRGGVPPLAGRAEPPPSSAISSKQSRASPRIPEASSTLISWSLRRLGRCQRPASPARYRDACLNPQLLDNDPNDDVSLGKNTIVLRTIESPSAISGASRIARRRCRGLDGARRHL